MGSANVRKWSTFLYHALLIITQFPIITRIIMGGGGGGMYMSHSSQAPMVVPPPRIGPASVCGHGLHRWEFLMGYWVPTGPRGSSVYTHRPSRCPRGCTERGGKGFLNGQSRGTEMNLKHDATKLDRERLEHQNETRHPPQPTEVGLQFWWGERTIARPQALLALDIAGPSLLCFFRQHDYQMLLNHVGKHNFTNPPKCPQPKNDATWHTF